MTVDSAESLMRAMSIIVLLRQTPLSRRYDAISPTLCQRYAAVMPPLCCRYATVMPALSHRYADAMSHLFHRYADAMPLFCRCYADVMRAFCRLCAAAMPLSFFSPSCRVKWQALKPVSFIIELDITVITKMSVLAM